MIFQIKIKQELQLNHSKDQEKKYHDIDLIGEILTRLNTKKQDVKKIKKLQKLSEGDKTADQISD